MTGTPQFWVARGDYSQIEARVNPWLFGAEWKLNAFRRFDTITGYEEKKGKRIPVRGGPDLYRVTAAIVLSMIRGRTVRPEDVTDAERQLYGKVPELALGFQGGAGAFQKMARVYGVKISDGQAEEIKGGWRGGNPEIKGGWRGLDSAAVRCMQDPPGREISVWTEDDRGDPMFKTPITFMRSRVALSMRLPSGTRLFYWTPRLVKSALPWGGWKWAVRYRAEDAQTKRWDEFTGYGGLFCENAVQATARDIMAYAMVALDRLGYGPRLTVHDEAITLMPRSIFPTPEDAARAVEHVMLDKPDWCGTLPVAADSSAGLRYVKG